MGMFSGSLNPFKGSSSGGGFNPMSMLGGGGGGGGFNPMDMLGGGGGGGMMGGFNPMSFLGGGGFLGGMDNMAGGGQESVGNNFVLPMFGGAKDSPGGDTGSGFLSGLSSMMNRSSSSPGSTFSSPGGLFSSGAFNDASSRSRSGGGIF